MQDDADGRPPDTEAIDPQALMTPEAAEDEAAVLHRKLIRRSLVAGGLVAILAVGLVWLQFGEERAAPALPVAEAPPVPIAPPPVETAPAPVTEAPTGQPDPPAEPQPEPQQERQQEPPQEPPSAPESVAAPPEPVPPVEAVPQQPAETVVPFLPSRGYRVQVGVFKDIDNVRQLQQRLDAAGLPVLIETRVQVGPFATRKEAEEARAKLRALGLEQGLLVPPTSRK